MWGWTWIAVLYVLEMSLFGGLGASSGSNPALRGHATRRATTANILVELLT